MPTIGKQRRRYVKGQFEKMAAGELVSDQERQAMQQERVSASEQAIGAQQQGLARASMAQTGGSPIAAGGMVKGAQALGQASAEAATKATGESQQLAAAVREKRAAQALAAGERLHMEQKQARARALEFGLRTAEVGAEIASL